MTKLNKLSKIIAASLATLLIVAIGLPILAQVHEPTGVFQINSVNVYRHVLETNDQLYVVTGTVEYGVSPSTPIDSSYVVRLMNGAVELGSTSFYPYHDSGYDLGMCSIYFNAASAPAWSGAYNINIEGNPTIHWLDTTAVTAMDGAVADDGGVLISELAAANNAAANDMTLLPAIPAVNDAYYFGSDTRFDLLTVNIGTAGNWTGTYAWEYWNGSNWVAPTGITDNTVGFTAGAGNYDVSYNCPEDWYVSAVNGVNLYWLRFRVVTYTGIVTQPLGTQSWTNSLATPPLITTNALNWIDEGTVEDAQNTLTVYLRTLARQIELDWAGTTDLIETIAGTMKLTDDGEDYFTNSIANLRSMCPELFSEVTLNPTFEHKDAIQIFNMGGADGDRDAGIANWFAQTFTTGTGFDVNGVDLLAYSNGIAGVLTVSIRATAAGLPAGADLCVGTINSNNFTANTDGNWYHVSFTTTSPLANNTVYAVVIRAVANQVSWLSDATGAYTGGQACSSVNAGVAWAAIAGEDFMFNITGDNAYSMSYRNRLASRLVGTRFDMTNNPLGVSRMWMSTIVWLIFMCMIPAVFFARAVDSYKPIGLVFIFMIPIGTYLGFIYLEIGALLAGFFSLGTIYTFWYSKAP